jgi:hypothetical protein
MSYNGCINFGLVGDFDVLFDLDDLAGDMALALTELADAAGVKPTQPQVLPPLSRKPASSAVKD